MQSIQTALEAVLTADSRIPKVRVRASWIKSQDQGISFATVGTSLVNGPDLVQGASAVITNGDLFTYMDESEYAMRLDYDRRIDEPRGGISYAIANVLLDNIDKRFTPDHNATIGTAIEARRPFKMSIGFDVSGIERAVQVMVGLTSSKPKQHRSESSVDVEIFDYITFINNAQIEVAVYDNVYGHEVIEDILQALGFGSVQYSLDQSLNLIPFVWFDKNKSAGQRIKEICEAEEATFYQDENGILRFENRDHVASFPHQTVQRTIDAEDILSDDDDESTRIINRAIVLSKPRVVDATANPIWENGVVEEIAAGATKTIWPAFRDEETGDNKLPVKEITTPASTTDYVGNSASDGSGINKTAQLSLVVTNFVESAKLEITNNDAAPVFVTFLQLRGKAARIAKAIQAVEEDADSINKYEAQEYSLENNLIQTQEMADLMARNLVAKYSNPMRRRIIRIPGIPHLQLKDLLYVFNTKQENLIQNPSFEVTTNNWEIDASGNADGVLSRSREIPIANGFFAGKIAIEQL